MDWIQNLLFNDASVAHTVILYAFVIALGVALGKMKFFGISLGVTFVLFVGLIAGHFGFSAEKKHTPFRTGVWADSIHLFHWTASRTEFFLFL